MSKTCFSLLAELRRLVEHDSNNMNNIHSTTYLLRITCRWLVGYAQDIIEASAEQVEMFTRSAWTYYHRLHRLRIR